MMHTVAARSNKEVQGLTRRAQAVLSRYAWPGNVRELENVIGHGCILTDGNFIDVHNLPDYLSVLHPETPDTGKKVIVSLLETERRYAREVVDQVKNKAQAANLLGISRTKLYRLLSKKSNDEFEGSG